MQKSTSRDQHGQGNLQRVTGTGMASHTAADLSATRAWIYAAESFRHPSTLLAYRTSLRLLVEHLSTLPSLPRHLDLLKKLTSRRSQSMRSLDVFVTVHFPMQSSFWSKDGVSFGSAA
ncbi:hypothetical protein V8E55_008287 [Tylopilus felleus]